MAERVRALMAAESEKRGWTPPTSEDAHVVAATLTALDLAACEDVSPADRETLMSKDEAYLERMASQVTPRFYGYQVATEAGFELARTELAKRLMARGLDVVFKTSGRTLFVRRI